MHLNYIVTYNRGKEQPVAMGIGVNEFAAMRRAIRELRRYRASVKRHGAFKITVWEPVARLIPRRGLITERNG